MEQTDSVGSNMGYRPDRRVPKAGKQINFKPRDDDFCFQLKGILPKIAFALGGLVGERGTIKSCAVAAIPVTT